MTAMHRWSALCCALAALVPCAANSAETTPAPAVAPIAAPTVTVAPVRTVDAARARLSAVQAAIEVLDRQIAIPPPKLLAAQLAEWKEHGEWLSSVRTRFATFLAENGGAFGDTPGLAGVAGADMTKKMAQMNMQFLALQEAVQAESRRFQTLSNASKARHEVAMNAIRNLK